MHRQSNTAEHRWLPSVEAQLVNIPNFHSVTELSATGTWYLIVVAFAICRNHRFHRNQRLPILSGCRSWPMAVVAAENRSKLAEVFHQSAGPSHTRIPRWPVHLCALLDVFVWHGARVLNPQTPTNRTKIIGTFCYYIQYIYS